MTVIFCPGASRVATVRVFLTVGFSLDEPTVNSNYELTVATNSAPSAVSNNIPRLAAFFVEHLVGFRVADELLLFAVPVQFSSQAE